jgi:hypothetical protein
MQQEAMMARLPSVVRSAPALVGMAALLLTALSACTTTPAPRGYAQTGVPSTYTRQIHDAAYYTGADPAFPRTGKASGGGGGE